MSRGISQGRGSVSAAEIRIKILFSTHICLMETFLLLYSPKIRQCCLQYPLCLSANGRNRKHSLFEIFLRITFLKSQGDAKVLYNLKYNT